METGVLKAVGQVAGLGGIALGVLLLVFRDVIRRNFFSTLTKPQSYKIIRLIIISVWSVALVGILAWVYTSTQARQESQTTNTQPVTPKPDTKVYPPEDPIIYREFDSKNKKVKISIKSIIIKNDGNADDLITIKASIKIPDLNKEDTSHSFGGDFDITDHTGRKLPRPFVLAKGTNLELNYSTTFSYSGRSTAAFEKEGMRRLTLMFNGQTNPTPILNICYGEIYTPGLHEFYVEECPKDF